MRLAVDMVVQDVLEIVCGKLVDDKQTFPQAVGLLFFVGQFPFLYLNIIFSC